MSKPIPPGHYTVFPASIEQIGPHRLRYNFEVLDGEYKGSMLQLNVDAINEIEITDGGSLPVKTTYTKLTECIWDGGKLREGIGADRYETLIGRVSALRVGEYTKYGFVTIKRIS